MFVPVRLIAIAFAALSISACERSLDADLIGTWRAEDKSSIREISFRRDHGFSTYYRHKPASDKLMALTNPSLPEDTGEWQLRRNRLEMIFKESNGAYVPSSTSLSIVKLEERELLLKRDDVANDKEFDYFGNALSLTRLNVRECKGNGAITDPRVTAQKIIGNWQVHYRTHDCTYRYNDDHSMEISIEGVQADNPILLGTWRVDRQTLVQDLRSPTSSESAQQHWSIMAMQDDCFVITDHHAEYTFSRISN